MHQDKPTIDRIAKLHPKLRVEARKIYDEAVAALTGNVSVRFTYTLRTFEEQAALYRLGRTVRNPDGASVKKPMGNIVTQAGAGQSIHNYGLAVDICLLIDKDRNGTYETASWDDLGDYDGDKVKDWMEIVAVFKKYGWEWGGDWKSFKDRPHFQKDFNYTWKQLLAKKNAKKVDAEGYVII